MMKRNLILFILSSAFCLLFSAVSFAQEQLTITTYYPSPYGSYNELRTERMAVGYIQRSDACWDPPCPGGGTDISDTLARDIDLIVQGNVGIGTKNPTVSLDIRRDQNDCTTLHIENQTAGTSACARLQLWSNSATGELSVLDDGLIVDDWGDKLILKGDM